jgi:hypothetical protein
VVIIVVSSAARKSARHRALMIRPASGSPAPGAPGDGLLPAGAVSAPLGFVSVAVGSLEPAFAPSLSTSRVLSELVLRSGVDDEVAIVAVQVVSLRGYE